MKHFLLLLFFLASKLCIAQVQITVIDSVSSESIIGAYVFQKDDESNAFITDDDGRVFISDASLPLTIIASHVGYQEDTTTISTDTEKLTIRLQPLTLDEIVVSANASRANHAKGVSTVLDIEKIKLLPSISGETDIFKAMSIMPGIQVGEEATSSLFVRGGNADQNLILLDEMPVFNTNHLLGYLNAFNATAIKNFQVMKGALPSKYGGRLSSVIKVDTKDGNRHKRKMELGLGLISSYFNINGPINDKWTYLVDVRSSYLTLIAPIINSFGDAKRNYWMYDKVIGVNYQQKNWRSSFRFYSSLDQLLSSDKEEYGQDGRNVISTDRLVTSWANRVASLSNTYTRKNLAFSLVSGISSYDYGRKNNYESIEYGSTDTIKKTYLYKASSRIFNIKNTASATMYFSDHTSGTVGVETNNYLFSASEREERRSSTRFTSMDISPFVDIETQITPNTKLKAGLRNSFYKNKSFSVSRIEPRASLTFAVSKNQSLILSYQNVNQFIQNINVGNFGFPNDLWVGSTANVPPPSVHQYDLQYKVDSKHFFAEVGLYYKSLSGLNKYRGEQDSESYYFPSLDSWESLIYTGGKGKTYGLELYLEKQFDRLSFFTAYTLSFSDRQYEQLNSGAWFPFIYDRRHDLSLTVLWNMSKNWKLSSSFMFQTGKAITVPVSRAPRGLERLLYSKINNARLPSYHKMDIGLTRSITTKKGRQSTLRISISNAYNRRNVIGIDYYIRYAKVKAIRSLPIIPSISWNYKID